MLQRIIELVLAPLLVAAAGVAGRRWGPQAGGVVSAFPAIVGPVLLITALDHGARFAARAAEATLLGLGALGAFALTYARLSERAGWRLTLLGAWAVAAVAAAAVGLVVGAAGPPAGLLIAGVSLFAAHRLLGTGGSSSPTAMVLHPDPGSVLLRMLATALLVITLAASARALGATAGGILAALPVLASVLAVVIHRQQGAAAVAALLRGMLAGMTGFIAFCEVLVLTLPGADLGVAFSAAILVALVVQIGTLRRQCSNVRRAITSSPRSIPNAV